MFCSVGDFEFTPECGIFDILSIKLYHGWLVDPQSTEYKAAIGSLSYNQLVEKIVASKEADGNSQSLSEGRFSVLHNPLSYNRAFKTSGCQSSGGWNKVYNWLLSKIWPGLSV